VENTFRHIALFRALGAPVPTYAHLPMIVNAQGKPYSKRDGAAFVGEFRQKGYLPEALFNYLALLGWSPGADREILSREEMIALFDLAQVHASPAQMDLRKLEWMNGEYIRRLPLETFAEQFRAALASSGVLSEPPDPAYLRQVAALMQVRTHTFGDVPAWAAFFFRDDFPWDEKTARKRLQKPGLPEKIQRFRETLAGLASFEAPAIEAALKAFAEKEGLPAADLIHAVRVAVSGLGVGPGLFEMLETLGRERVLTRLERALQRYGTDALEDRPSHAAS